MRTVVALVAVAAEREMGGGLSNTRTAPYAADASATMTAGNIVHLVVLHLEAVVLDLVGQILRVRVVCLQATDPTTTTM